MALAAGNAAVNILVPHMEQLGLDALGFQGVLQLGQGRPGAAPCPGAAVDQQGFHGDLSFRVGNRRLTPLDMSSCVAANPAG